MSEDPTAEPAESPRPHTGVSTIANVNLLRTVWKREIRPRLRAAKLRDYYFAQDPVQFAAYEWGLVPFLAHLSDELRSGRYTPQPATLIRGAKSVGLSRPLAVLTPRDALVYRTAILRAEPDLKRDLRKWTGATQADGQRMRLQEIVVVEEVSEGSAAPAAGQVTAGSESSDDEADEDSEEADDRTRSLLSTDSESYEDDWFSVWLAKQAIIAHICQTKPYIALSDISNFFTSIDLEVAREHLLSHTGLDKEAVRLVIQLIRRVMPHPRFAEHPTSGLPQENFDSSRAIAHSLLVEVDSEFDKEGGAGVYSRFMDDFAIGADSLEDGHVKVSRLQVRLERIGLYPNPAKTRVLDTATYMRDLMVETNGYLERVDRILGALDTRQVQESPVEPQLQEELADRFMAHCAIPTDERATHWDRVSRRFYTLLRRARVEDFVGRAMEDLKSLPSSAPTVLEYIRSFTVTQETVENLFALAISEGGLYGSIPLLVLETVGSCPNDGTEEFRSTVTEQVQRLIGALPLGNHGEISDFNDRICAALVPLVGKFGSAEDQRGFLDELEERFPPESPARIAAAPLQLNLDPNTDSLGGKVLPGLPWQSVLAIEYLIALRSGDLDAVGVGLGLLSAQERLQPLRYHVHSRPLLLVPAINQAAPERLRQVAAASRDRLATNPASLRDRRAEELLHVS